MGAVENQCTLLLSGSGSTDSKLEDIKKLMESNEDEDKIKAMQEVRINHSDCNLSLSGPESRSQYMLCV